MPGGLTAAQLQTFCADGVVIVPDLVPPPQVQAWRAQLWDVLTIDPGDPLPSSGAGSRNSSLFLPRCRARLQHPYPDPAEVADPRPVEPALGEEPHVKAVLDQLLGAGTWGAGIAGPPAADAGIEMDTVMFRWPLHEEEAAEKAAVAGQASDRTSTWKSEYGRDKVIGRPHIEGYRGPQKGGPTTAWQLGITIALADIKPGGGGTYFWPGSCHAVHRYFERHPGDLRTGGALATAHPGSPSSAHGLPCPGGYDLRIHGADVSWRIWGQRTLRGGHVCWKCRRVASLVCPCG
eukprot:SAG31_NODE_3223_length_4523_cov_2.474910_4_plen_291_part_00